MVLSRAREKGLEADELVALGEQEQVPAYVAAGPVPPQLPRQPRRPVRHRLRRPDPARGHRGDRPPRRAATAVPARVRRRVPGHRPRPGRPAPRPGRRRRRPRRRGRPAPVDLRVPGCGGARHPRVPGRLPAGRRLAGAGRVAADDAALRPAAARRHPAGGRPHRAARRHRRRGPRVLPPPGRGRRRHRRRAWRGCSPSTPSAPRPSTSPTCSAAPTSRTACPWDRMAVLVRSGRASIPPLRRALGAAGVPVEVARDDLPLVQDPSVLPLLDALRAAVNIDNDDDESADYVDHARAESLLLGPLGGLDAGDVRRLARLLRVREKDAAHADVAPAAHLQGAGPAGGAPRRLPRRDPGPEAAAARALHTLVRATADGLAEGGTAEDALWALWSGTDWPGRLRAVGRAGRGSGPPRPPRPRLGRRAVRRGRPRGREARRGRRLGRGGRPRLPVAAGRPADPGRHAGRAGRARRRGPAADRPPVQGPRVGPRRGRPRPAGRLARPAPPLDDAPGRPHRHRRPRAGRARPADDRARAAAGGAPPLLRRLHPRPLAARRHRRRLRRGRRRAAVAVPRRARRHRREGRGPARPAAVAGRAWSASCAAPSPTPARRPAAARGGRAPAGPAGRRDRRRPAAGAAGRPVVAGGAPAPRPGRCSRCATPTSRCRSRPRCSRP